MDVSPRPGHSARLFLVAVLQPALMAACGGRALAPSGPASPTANVDIVPSRMMGDLRAIGVDLSSPSDLASLPTSKKRNLMPLFVKALGMSGCSGCHVISDEKSDFRADTPNKRMAGAMWNHFVRDLRMREGGALFCDSCHQGSPKILARSDKRALSSFMRANYQEKLERADRKEHSCATCHSNPFEGKVFAKLWKVSP